jgi:hypothetical protein
LFEHNVPSDHEWLFVIMGSILAETSLRGNAECGVKRVTQRTQSQKHRGHRDTKASFTEGSEGSKEMERISELPLSFLKELPGLAE